VHSVVELLQGNGIKTVNEAAIVGALAVKGPLTMTELQRAVGFPYTSVSRVAWSLRERGLLSHQSDGTDRRVVRVSLVLSAFKP
jgi:DNA-binding MarR family transcriptional regulator